MDHVPPHVGSGGKSEPNELEKNITSRATWIRLFFMVIFALLYGLSRLVTAAVVVVQFFHVLFSGRTNDQLKSFGHSLAIYSYEVVKYLTFNSETKPYPLDARWPDSLPVEQDVADDD
jgi:hypothetical protein